MSKRYDRRLKRQQFKKSKLDERAEKIRKDKADGVVQIKYVVGADAAKPSSMYDAFMAYHEAEHSMMEMYSRSIFGSYLKPPPPTTWVKDAVSTKDLLKEIKQRPHGRFPELDDTPWGEKSNGHCKCDGCRYQRQRLIRELTDTNCENR